MHGRHVSPSTGNKKKASQAKQGWQVKLRLPITPSILIQIKGFLNKQPEEFDNIMAWAAFGFLCDLHPFRQ